MANVSPKRVQEIARTSHSVIDKCIRANSFVTVKRIVATPRAKNLWQTEVNALTSIGSHPHIATLLSSHEPLLTITLRYETGRSLNTFVDSNLISTLPLGTCHQILPQTAAALSFIHSLRIIHDDVNPFNIIWSPPDNRAVLIDFGAALFDSNFTESGTPPYAAPKYLARVKTDKSDIWAFGVTLAFVFGYFPLPSGDWLLPNALLSGTEERREMDEWLAFVGFVARDAIDRSEPLVGEMLRVRLDERISSEELCEKLSLQEDSELE